MIWGKAKGFLLFGMLLGDFSVQPRFRINDLKKENNHAQAKNGLFPLQTLSRPDIQINQAIIYKRLRNYCYLYSRCWQPE